MKEVNCLQIIGLGLLLFFVSGCSSLQQVFQIEGSTQYKGCPNGIIPDVVTLEISEKSPVLGDKLNGLYLDPFYSKSKWQDSQKIEIYPHGSNTFDTAMNSVYAPCKKGSSEGQNVNYYYCDYLHYLKSVTPISEGGVIGKTETTEYIISLVLKEKDRYQDTGEWKWQERVYGDFEVITAECRTP